MVDLQWAPEGGPAAVTFLKDSVPGDEIGAIMNEALRTWNKGAQAMVVGYESRTAQHDSLTDTGSGLDLDGMAGDDSNESEEE
jgi:hypothetical protein